MWFGRCTSDGACAVSCCLSRRQRCQLGAAQPSLRAQTPVRRLPQLLQLADYLLVEPKQPSRFWRDNEGSDAAFLKLRYGNLSSAETSSLLNALASSAEAAGTNSRTRSRACQHGKPSSRDRHSSESRIGRSRAEGVGPARVDRRRRWRLAVRGACSWRGAAPKDFAGSFVFANIARAVADIGDDALATLARRAEAAGLWRLGYEFYALRNDFSDLVAFLNRMPEQSLGGGAQTPGEKRKNLLGQALSQASFRSPALEMTKQPVEVAALLGERPHLAMMRPFGPLLARAPDTALLVNDPQPDRRKASRDRSSERVAGRYRSPVNSIPRPLPIR